MKLKFSKSRIGDKVYLESVDGEWFKPKKFSVEEKDQIQACQQEILKMSGISVAQIKSIEKLSKGREEGEAIEDVPDSDLEAYMALSAAPVARLMRAQLLYGIAEHSFDAESESSTLVDEQVVTEIMNYPEIATEIVNAVELFNRPLAKETSATSEMSQSGSTGEVSSTKKTPSPMGETPQT